MIVGMVVDNEFSNDPRVKNEAILLAKAGHTVRVLCLSYGNKSLNEIVDNVEIFRIKISRKIKNFLFAVMNTLPFYHYWWARKISIFIQKQQIDVLHAHDLYMARSAAKAAKKKGIKLVLDLHENYPYAVLGYKWAQKFPINLLARPHKWQLVEKNYLEKADRIIVLSQDYRNILVNKYNIPIDFFTVFPNVPNIRELINYRIDEKIIDKGKRFFLFYFGGISERRGIFTCIDALKLIIKDYPMVTLLLIGPVDKAEKKQFLKTISMPEVIDHIIYIPWCEIEFLPSYISVSDICLSPILKNPQHESGIANKVFQYMLFERPIIVSNCKPQMELIEEANCGLVFESGNALSLANSIHILIQDTRLRKEMGSMGKNHIVSKYNEEHFGKSLVSLYEQLQ